MLMSDPRTAMMPNRIVRYLGVPPEEFTKEGLIRFMQDNDIRMVNFRYVGGDGRLKNLSCPITSKAQLDRLLSTGERVDGSSIFAYVDAASSDLYVVPRYKTAYVNPFSAVPAVDILCSYYTSEGSPLPSSPQNILQKAEGELRDSTGLTMQAMGELEYYVLAEPEDSYPVSPQQGYHESAPFTRHAGLRSEAMQIIAEAGGSIKYGHSEVGTFYAENLAMEQHEIEFSPVPLADAADQIVIAKWVLRMLGRKYGATVTFAPKILGGHAGTGLHVHTRLLKNGRNVMVEGDGLSDVARKAIAGYLSLAGSLTAFVNTVPTSYLRLVPHQEAPTNICWGDRNRSVLVRVPLGWLGVANMVKDANPQEPGDFEGDAQSQTVEFRSPDGSANIHLLLAGLAVAARHGLQMPGAMKLADKLYVDTNIFRDDQKKLRDRLPQLPSSCWASAENLLKDREAYEKQGVFPAGVIERTASDLKKYDDRDLSERISGNKQEVEKLVELYLHCS